LPSSASLGLNNSGSSVLPVRQNEPCFEVILYNMHPSRGLYLASLSASLYRVIQSRSAKTFQGSFSPSDSRVLEVLLGTIITTLLASIFVGCEAVHKNLHHKELGLGRHINNNNMGNLSQRFFTPISILKID
jgi:hypothetical protein